MTDLPSLPALRSGDPAAWRALFENYAQPLYLYAYHRCGDATTAEDIRQETFLAALEAVDQYRGEASLFGWLCGIARHKAADRQRRANRPVQPLEMEEGSQEEMPDPRQPQPENAAIDSETRAAVVEALWSLPEEYRSALVWRYAREETVEQVAGRLNRTYKAAESLLSRARAALRNQLHQEEQDAETE